MHSFGRAACAWHMAKSLNLEEPEEIFDTVVETELKKVMADLDIY